jgi:hypothetical protein
MKTLLLLVTTFATCAIFADERKPAEPAKPAGPAAAAEVPRVFAPTDLEPLQAEKGRKIHVEGVIAATGANKTDSIRYLNFTKNFRESVSLVFFANAGGGTFTKEKLADYVGKRVRVNGVLTDYNGALQIKVESLDQVKLVPVESAPAQ